MADQKYWPTTESMTGHDSVMELRAQLAWEMLRVFGLSALRGERNPQENAVFPDEDTVARAFAVADAFVKMAEERGELRPFTDEDATKAHEAMGRLMRAQERAQYPDRAILEKTARELREGSYNPPAGDIDSD